MTGDLSKDRRTSTIQRQSKYKIQALMELGILEDARKIKSNNLVLTNTGKDLVDEFKPLLQKININLTDPLSWRMQKNESYFNNEIAKFLDNNSNAKKLWLSILLNFDAFEQLLHVFYRELQTEIISKNNLYENFFQSPYVLSFIESNGIEIPSLEGSRRRVPFLNNLAESIVILEIKRSELVLNNFAVYKKLLILSGNETKQELLKRKELAEVPQSFNISEELENMKELFGPKFGTDNFLFTKDDVLVLEDF